MLVSYTNNQNPEPILGYSLPCVSMGERPLMCGAILPKKRCRPTSYMLLIAALRVFICCALRQSVRKWPHGNEPFSTHLLVWFFLLFWEPSTREGSFSGFIRFAFSTVCIIFSFISIFPKKSQFFKTCSQFCKNICRNSIIFFIYFKSSDFSKTILCYENFFIIILYIVLKFAK